MKPWNTVTLIGGAVPTTVLAFGAAFLAVVSTLQILMFQFQALPYLLLGLSGVAGCASLWVVSLCGNRLPGRICIGIAVGLVSGILALSWFIITTLRFHHSSEDKLVAIVFIVPLVIAFVTVARLRASPNPSQHNKRKAQPKIGQVSSEGAPSDEPSM